MLPQQHIALPGNLQHWPQHVTTNAGKRPRLLMDIQPEAAALVHFRPVAGLQLIHAGMGALAGLFSPRMVALGLGLFCGSGSVEAGPADRGA